MSLIKTNWMNGVTATGVSTTENVLGCTQFMMTAHATGGPSLYSLGLEGSIDGTDWFTLILPPNGAQGGNGTNSGSHHSDVYNPQSTYNGNVPVLVRLNLLSFSGGSSPAFFASVLAY